MLIVFRQTHIIARDILHQFVQQGPVFLIADLNTVLLYQKQILLLDAEYLLHIIRFESRRQPVYSPIFSIQEQRAGHIFSTRNVHTFNEFASQIILEHRSIQ